MKLKLNILSAVLLGMFLAGCSDEEGVMPLTSDDRAVEIRLSLAETAAMRAAIDSDADSNFTIEGSDGSLGIFCLSAQELMAGATIPEIDWTVSNSAVSKNNVCMNNVAAKALDGKISWNGRYYYPMGGWYGYRFYGYYPRMASPVATKGALTVDYVLDGSQDVIWGRTSYDGYCAAYFASSYNDIPQLALEHCLTRLKFEAVLNTDAVKRDIRVTNIRIVNVPTHQTLTIADRANPGREGKLTPTDNTKSVISLSSLDKMNEGVMLPPASDYYIGVTMIDGEGKNCSPKGYFQLAPAGGFEAGKIYSIQMRISGAPEDIQGSDIDIISD